MASQQNTILIVGASRGIGLGLVDEHLRRGWNVIATVRDQQHPTQLHRLAEQQGSGRLEIETVDINVPEQVSGLRDRLQSRLLDVLFVNAGVGSPTTAMGGVSTDEFMRVMVTNTLSPMRVIEAFSELVKPNGVIAAMSSGLGSVANNETGGWEVYRASKAALNTSLRSFAARQNSPEAAILALAPGWVRTDMGGPDAMLDVATSVRGLADVIESRRGARGVAYLDYQGHVLPW